MLSSPRAGVRRWLTMTSTIKYARWNTQGDRKTRSPLNYALSFIMKRPILSLKFSSKWGEGDRISKQKENFVLFILRKGILSVVFLFFSEFWFCFFLRFWQKLHGKIEKDFPYQIFEQHGMRERKKMCKEFLFVFHYFLEIFEIHTLGNDSKNSSRRSYHGRDYD